VAAVHVQGPIVASDQRRLPTILIRPDHIDPDQEVFVEDWRCVDCLHHDIDEALGLTPGVAS